MSDCDSGTSVLVVLVVAVVLVFPFLRCDGFKLAPDRESVEPQFFFFSKKRSSVLEERKEEMGYAGSPVKALPNTRRRILPPTPQQISFSSTTKVSGKWIWKHNHVSGALGKEG